VRKKVCFMKEKMYNSLSVNIKQSDRFKTVKHELNKIYLTMVAVVPN